MVVFQEYSESPWEYISSTCNSVGKIARHEARVRRLRGLELATSGEKSSNKELIFRTKCG